MEHLHREIAITVSTKTRGLQLRRVKDIPMVVTVKPELAVIILGPRTKMQPSRSTPPGTASADNLRIVCVMKSETKGKSPSRALKHGFLLSISIHGFEIR